MTGWKIYSPDNKTPNKTDFNKFNTKTSKTPPNEELVSL